MPTLNGNLYRCRARNSFGQRFSNPALLTVTVGPVPTPCPGHPAFYSASYTGVTNYGGGRSIDFSGTLSWVSGTSYLFTGQAILAGPWGGGAAVSQVSFGDEIVSGNQGSIPSCTNLNVSIWATVTGGTNPGSYISAGHDWDPIGFANIG